MNILLISDSYPPEIRSASHLMQEMAAGLSGRGHRVHVLTSTPRYNLSGARREFAEVEDEDGIQVIRVATLPHHKVHFALRGIAQLLMPGTFLRKARKHIPAKLDAVVVYSPPLTLASVGAALKREQGARFILNVQDIFPQNAIDLGVLKNRLLIKMFETIEARAYRSADEILVHSEGNRDFVSKKSSVDPAKLDTLHNWVDVSSFEASKRTGDFRTKFGLKSDDFVILFAGVVGPSQGLDFIVKAAAELADLPDLRFLIVGDGTEKPRLEQLARSAGASNVVFAPFVSKDEYPSLVAEADIGLVCLSSKNHTPVVPGKLMGYMAAGVPALAFLQKESDGHALIDEARCGFSAVSDDVSLAVDLIRRVVASKGELQDLGKNGRDYVTKHLSLDGAVSAMEQALGGEDAPERDESEPRAPVRERDPMGEASGRELQ